MKKVFGGILAITMILSYTVFAEEYYYEEEYQDKYYEGSAEEPAEDITVEDEYDINIESEEIYEEVYEQDIPASNNTVTENKSIIKVYVNSRRILFDTDPMIVNSRTMVPVRAIFEALGATVTWDNDTQTAIGVMGDITVKITIGQSYLTRNDEVKELDSPAFLTSGRTYVPARAIAESFDCKVGWDNDTQTVTITNR